jgi:hypothetical protein
MMKGKVVLVPFPFDDLSTTKVRPAVCLIRSRQSTSPCYYGLYHRSLYPAALLRLGVPTQRLTSSRMSIDQLETDLILKELQ